MNEQVTLAISETLILRAREDAARSGVTFEEVLTHWLERGASESLLSLESGVEYPVFTPYGNEDAGRILLEFLQSEQADGQPDNA
jgi:hypothetical protein